MFGVRILLVATAYTVVMLEIYSGAINGPQWWVYPGALVIALLLSLSMFGWTPAGAEAPRQSTLISAVQWVLVLGTAFAMSWFANYFGRTLLPEIIAP